MMSRPLCFCKGENITWQQQKKLVFRATPAFLRSHGLRENPSGKMNNSMYMYVYHRKFWQFLGTSRSWPIKEAWGRGLRHIISFCYFIEPCKPPLRLQEQRRRVPEEHGSYDAAKKQNGGRIYFLCIYEIHVVVNMQAHYVLHASIYGSVRTKKNIAED